MLDHNERRLAVAVLISLAIHVTALTVFPELRSRPPKEPAPLQVDLVPMAPPQPKVVESPPQPAPPIEPLPEPVVEPTSRMEEPRPKPKPKVVRKKEPPKIEAPKPEPAPIEPEPAPPPVIATAPPPELAPPPVFEVPKPRDEPPPPKVAEPSPEIQSGYEKELSRLVDRYKRYPRIAKQRGWEGLVRVTIDIGPEGKVSNIAVTQSSGYEALDTSALAAVKSAQPFPTAPGSLWGKRINVPISFNLIDG